MKKISWYFPIRKQRNNDKNKRKNKEKIHHTFSKDINGSKKLTQTKLNFDSKCCRPWGG